MKKLFSVLVLSVLLTSCFNSKKGEIEVDITTFQGPVKFSNLCEDKLSGKDEITDHVQNMCSKVKYSCSNSATFIPLTCSFYTGKDLGDTVIISLTGTAENGYGVSTEILGYGTIVKGKLLDEVIVF